MGGDFSSKELNLPHLKALDNSKGRDD